MNIQQSMKIYLLFVTVIIIVVFIIIIINVYFWKMNVFHSLVLTVTSKEEII